MKALGPVGLDGICVERKTCMKAVATDMIKHHHTPGVANCDRKQWDKHSTLMHKAVLAAWHWILVVLHSNQPEIVAQVPSRPASPISELLHRTRCSGTPTVPHQWLNTFPCILPQGPRTMAYGTRSMPHHSETTSWQLPLFLPLLTHTTKHCGLKAILQRYQRLALDGGKTNTAAPQKQPCRLSPLLPDCSLSLTA